MKRHRGIKSKSTPLGAMIFGIVFSFLSLIALSLVASAILMMGKNPTGNLSLASFAVFLIAGAVSGFIISKHKGDGSIGIAIIASLIFIGIMLAVALITAKGKVSGAVFMNSLCYMLISSFTAFLGRKREKRRHR